MEGEIEDRRDSRLVGFQRGVSNIGRHHRDTIKSWEKSNGVTFHLVPPLGARLSLKPTQSIQ